MANTNPLQFIQQVRGEVAKVVWPSRREVVLTTIMVFIMAALTATFFQSGGFRNPAGADSGADRLRLTGFHDTP